MSLEIDRTIESIVKFPKGYAAKLEYNLWLTRDVNKDDSVVDSDGSWIELIVGREWGDYASLSFEDLESLKLMIDELQRFAANAEVLRAEGLKELPSDFNPKKFSWNM